ncbi:MAG: DUF4129 domain-containing protein [Chloroflexi bacterium]|nr:DUF4129 domain-containing protein [Chloroflexota bacterium]
MPGGGLPTTPDHVVGRGRGGGGRAGGGAPPPGQTVIEFGSVAGRRLDAPLFASIADAFDGLRYGRHEPMPERLDDLERRFADWERANPLPDADGEEAEPGEGDS